MKTLHFTRLSFILVLLVSLLGAPTPAQAAVVNVPCSTPALIAAIQTANGTPADDVLNLQAGCTYLLTQSNNTTNGANGLPVIAAQATAGKLTINGSGASILRAEHRVLLPMLTRAGSSGGSAAPGAKAALQPADARGVPDFRIILVASGGHLTLNVVTLGHGSLPDGLGGGVFNGGTLIINGGAITGNSAGIGGGIYNVGNLTVINNTTISNNTAGNSGGGIHSGGGAINVSATLFVGNTAYVGDGIFVSEGASSVTNVTFTGDTSFTCPDLSAAIPAGDVAKLKQAIQCANALPTDDVISLTAGTYSLTAVDNTNEWLGDNGLPVIRDAAAAGTLTIHGGGAVIKRSSAPSTSDFRLIMVATGGDLTLNQLTLRSGRLTGFNGGAIHVDSAALTLNNSTLTGNTAQYGGGLAGNGTITVTNSTFTANQTTRDGAAINVYGNVSVSGSLFTGNEATGLGGGILIGDGQVTVTDTTFSNNAAHEMAGGGGLMILNSTVATVSGCTFANNTVDGAGGGLFAGGVSATVTNSTFTGNFAAIGGAIWNGGNLTLAHVTISGNAADGEGGGYFQANETAVVYLSHTLLAGNTANHGGPDIYGTVDSLGYNIIGTTSGAAINGDTTGNRINAAASPLNLGLLQDNGGPTHTMALVPGSVAIDAGNPAFTAPPAYDQRGTGHARVYGSRIDIGAYEYENTFACPASPYTVPAGDVDALIRAIDCANDSSTNDVLNLTPGTYTLTAVNNNGYASGGTGLPIIEDQATAGTLTINGSGAVIERSSAPGTPEFRHIMVGYGGNLTLNQLTLRNGRLSGFDGGAIQVFSATLTLNYSTVTGNTAQTGGGLIGDGTITVTNSTFSANTTTGNFAAFVATGVISVSDSLITGNEAAGIGGGISIDGGTAAITGTTFSNNASHELAGGGGLGVANTAVATVSGCTFANNTVSGAGGALFAGGASTTVINSTFTGNYAAIGGAIWNSSNLTLVHVTISGNAADGEGGGYYQDQDSPMAVVHLSHTIVAGNTANNGGPDMYGAVDSLGYNIIGTTIGATITGDTTGNLVGAAASPLNLGLLQNNGGLTHTMALNAGSVAINAGNPAFTSPPALDQRGQPRVSGGRIDIGAYESSY